MDGWTFGTGYGAEELTSGVPRKGLIVPHGLGSHKRDIPPYFLRPSVSFFNKNTTDV